MADLTKEGLRRNPFIFLGHFNIPFQGALEKLAKSRNPFIFLGHFNFFKEVSAMERVLIRSQSLHFLRAFQHKDRQERGGSGSLYVAIPSFS